MWYMYTVCTCMYMYMNMTQSRKECTNAIYSNTDGPRDYYTK